MTGTTWSIHPQLSLSAGGIEENDGLRQTRTAEEILRRFETMPGQVLADEVGMGKTFVALAVAASVAREAAQPVVVTVPPRLFDKWQRDIGRFRRRCLEMPDTAEEDRLRFRCAMTGSEFLRCFDDPPDRAPHLVLLSNTALHRMDRDPLIRLELIRKAMGLIRNGDSIRRAVRRWVHELLSGAGIRKFKQDVVVELLDRPPAQWRALLERRGYPLDDDPVPKAFSDAIQLENLQRTAEVLKRIPLRKSAYFAERIAEARSELGAVLSDLWSQVFRHANIRSPLLVFDEAHHLKNPNTRLASLFQDPASENTSVFSDAFGRMLFLTATPFQLGHRELLEVLRRFRSIHWSHMPTDRRLGVVDREIEALASTLDLAQSEAVRLDKQWANLTSTDVETGSEDGVADDWWNGAAQPRRRTPAMEATISQYARTRKEMGEAERCLRPWVIRHMRSRVLGSSTGDIPRRVVYPGRGIEGERAESGGMDIGGDSRFPFLLCVRAQTLLTRRPSRRAYFAEGLASSFGAFLETSEGARPVDDPDCELEDGAEDVAWYVARLRTFFEGRSVPHPKVEATADRAVRHWAEGQKVLVFCHYRMTIRDMVEAIDSRLGKEIGIQAARALSLNKTATKEARGRVDRICRRIEDRDSPLRKNIGDVLQSWVAEYAKLPSPQVDMIVDLLLRTLATPGFVVRNFPLDRPEVRASLEADRPTITEARKAAEAVAESLRLRKGNRLAYHGRVRSFVRHIVEEHEGNEPREAFLSSLGGMQRDPVRIAHGGVDQATRQLVLLGFNSPLLPEILVASEVMAEGLDLHLDCRHVIHHDLSWNPSTLEQRTGRVDRIRCWAEQEGRSIRVYMPYLAGTADEKMYRVVTDRARWFQVVMGEKYTVDESSTEKLMSRVPFPVEAASALTFDLSVHRPNQPH